MKYTEDPYIQTNSIEIQTHAVLHYPHSYIAKISAQNPIMHINTNNKFLITLIN